MVTYREIDTPLGAMRAVAAGARLAGLYFVGQKHIPEVGPDWQRRDSLPLFEHLRAVLAEYFGGIRPVFDLPLGLSGTPFQLGVWRALAEIPCGTTLSYGELARRIGRPSSVRAVAAAVGRNPVTLVLPCHRVIGADGTLTGYAGGIERKRALLDLEAAAVHARDDEPPVCIE